MWANNTSQFVTFAGKENNISPGNKNVSEFAIVKLLQSNLMRSEKIKIHLEGKMTEREVIYPLKNPLHQPHVSSLKPTSWFPKSYYVRCVLEKSEETGQVEWSGVQMKKWQAYVMVWSTMQYSTISKASIDWFEGQSDNDAI